MGEDRHVPPSPRLPQTPLPKKPFVIANHLLIVGVCMRYATDGIVDIVCDDESAQNSRQVGQEATGLD